MEPAPVAVTLLQVPDCPLVDGARAMVRRTARDLGVEIRLIDVVGDHPSPTVVIDGQDVVTGRAPAGDPACRLDLPTTEQLAAALRRSAAPR